MPKSLTLSASIRQRLTLQERQRLDHWTTEHRQRGETMVALQRAYTNAVRRSTESDSTLRKMADKGFKAEMKALQAKETLEKTLEALRRKYGRSRARPQSGGAFTTLESLNNAIASYKELTLDKLQETLEKMEQERDQYKVAEPQSAQRQMILTRLTLLSKNIHNAFSVNLSILNQLRQSQGFNDTLNALGQELYPKYQTLWARRKDLLCSLGISEDPSSKISAAWQLKEFKEIYFAHFKIIKEFKGLSSIGGSSNRGSSNRGSSNRGSSNNKSSNNKSSNKKKSKRDQRGGGSCLSRIGAPTQVTPLTGDEIQTMNDEFSNLFELTPEEINELLSDMEALEAELEATTLPGQTANNLGINV